MREGRALGSPLRLLVAAGQHARAVDEAWLDVLRAFEDVDAAMSRYRPDSELTRLNRRRGRPTGVSRLLMAALAMAERARRITSGRFDPRVVVDLERLGFTAAPQAWTKRPPADEPVLRRAPDGRVELSGPVDLGGLGKGLALRRACRAGAVRLPGSGFLIDAGGDIVTLGRPDPANAASRWSIALEDPSGGTEPLATCELPDGWAVATSSTRIARRLDDAGTMVHHLIDPRTGRPGGGGLVAVSVAFPDPAWAEVWTKELFLEGPSGIGARARGRGLAAWWVAADGSLSMTPAARQLSTWVRSEVELSPPAASVLPRPPSPNLAMG
ncbi:MAG TPA: FAD:protein FMN transferase [Patescibacteria group bacterium]|nr:FAD:protein FMN transferase [Patescibacteria group bacterium]